MRPGRRRAEAPHPDPPREHRPWRVEGSRGEQPPPGDGAPQRPPRPRGSFWLIMLLLLALNWAVVASLPRASTTATIPYSAFRQEVLAGNVTQVTSTGATIDGRLRHPLAHPPAGVAGGTLAFRTERPAYADDPLLRMLLAHHVRIEATAPKAGGSGWGGLLLAFGPVVLLVGALVFFMRRSAGAGGPFGAMRRSRARRYEAGGRRTTFADVAGIEEATDELAEVVDFLRHPDRYLRLGGTIPRGVLLTGPPGTGKTLLARAVAGEADVPFFSLSASEFVEMFVGVGASRVRDLFEQAKREAPAIVFIDELDAIGRARGAGGLAGGNDEREQTLNQILTELDGFTGAEGVIVLAATNRPEILDPALLRAGRFDRRIAVNPPDREGRAKILRVHTRSVPLAPDVDLDLLAATTPGMVGADLRNLVNEAALAAARDGATNVDLAHFTAALEKIVLGAARRIVLSPGERRRTAYHESGHALLGMLQPGADPVRKVSIIPRGKALGVTYQSPEQDRYGYDVDYLRGRIVGALGGRAAEQLVLDQISTGAESDLEQATSLARQMVGRWGMSGRLGLMSVLPAPGEETLLLPGAPGAVSERTREIVDDEVRAIIDACYGVALATLGAHREQLDALAAALLERETLDEAEAYGAAGLAAPAVDAVHRAESRAARPAVPSAV